MLFNKISLVSALTLLPSFALADSHCTYAIYSEGGDPSKTGAKVAVQSFLNAHTLAEKGALPVNQTLDECLKKASELLGTHRELNAKNKHEFPTIKVSFKSDTEKVSVKIHQIDLKKEKKSK